MSILAKIQGSWLTVNRRCNLRCKWCYALGAEYKPADEMSPELAFKLIDLKKALGIKLFIFIGGEPTLWPYLFMANNYAHQCGLETQIATNGLRFADPDFVAQFEESRIDSIDISLKAGNAEQHRRLTQSDSFKKVLAGIRYLADAKREMGVSLVIGPASAGNLDEAVQAAVDAGAQNVSVHFCLSSLSGKITGKSQAFHPKEAVQALLRHYQKINALTQGRFIAHVSVPFCLWPKDFLGELKKKKQIISGCQVTQNNGLVFGPQGQIFPCNGFYTHPLGGYGEDFIDAESFHRFWQSREVREFYDRIIAYPAKACIECPDYNECGGGCPLQWFIFDPDEVICGNR